MCSVRFFLFSSSFFSFLVLSHSLPRLCSPFRFSSFPFLFLSTCPLWFPSLFSSEGKENKEKGKKEKRRQAKDKRDKTRQQKRIREEKNNFLVLSSRSFLFFVLFLSFAFLLSLLCLLLFCFFLSFLFLSLFSPLLFSRKKEKERMKKKKTRQDKKRRDKTRRN